jgi:hypothetical protein
MSSFLDEQFSSHLRKRRATSTERYLGVEQDLTDVPCDQSGLKLE